MTASTRRAALGAILAAPLASVPALAVTRALPDYEARFLALIPQLRRMLPPLERAKSVMRSLYDLGDLRAGDYPNGGDVKARKAWSDRAHAARRINGYPEAWEDVSVRSAEIDPLVADFMNQRMTTLAAIAWKARLADVLDCWEEEAGSDLAAWAREDEACA